MLVLRRLPLVRADRIRSVTALAKKPILIRAALVGVPSRVLDLRAGGVLATCAAQSFVWEIVGVVLLVRMLI